MIPKRGEIWLVNLDPTVGAEIRKTRPVIVISSDYIGKLPLKLVVPVTDWKDSFTSDLWHIRLDPSDDNGLPLEKYSSSLFLRCVRGASLKENRVFLPRYRGLDRLVSSPRIPRQRIPTTFPQFRDSFACTIGDRQTLRRPARKSAAQGWQVPNAAPTPRNPGQKRRYF
jgi:mRNA-degrading endonuclease toxin of MazEF toxin-antitoxin module